MGKRKEAGDKITWNHIGLFTRNIFGVLQLETQKKEGEKGD